MRLYFVSGSYLALGIGLGPMNLAIAAMLHEEHPGEKNIFLEKERCFTWHPGMLMENASMQTPFLKDLVTTRNPCSYFTFINFLKEHGNLDEFISLRNLFPTRLEFSQYLSWVATKLSKNISYSSEVTKILPIKKLGKIEELEVHLEDSLGKRKFLAKNVILGMGFKPNLPSGIEVDDKKIFHSSNFLRRITDNYPDLLKPYSFAVVGSGQSAAEIALYLMSNYKNSKITVLSRGFVFRGLDDNPIINLLYASDSGEKFYSMPEISKKNYLEHLTTSNFSAADSSTIMEIARLNYQRKHQQLPTINLIHFCHIISAFVKENHCEINIRNTVSDQSEHLKFDGVLLATGYDNKEPSIPILDELKDNFILDSDGKYMTDFNHRMIAKDNFLPGVYLPNHFHNIHGFTQGTIADLPFKAKKVVSHIMNLEHSCKR